MIIRSEMQCNCSPIPPSSRKYTLAHTSCVLLSSSSGPFWVYVGHYSKQAIWAIACLAELSVTWHSVDVSVYVCLQDAMLVSRCRPTSVTVYMT